MWSNWSVDIKRVKAKSPHVCCLSLNENLKGIVDFTFYVLVL